MLLLYPIQTLLAVIAGGLVIPLVGGLKATGVSNYVKPEFLKFALLTLAAWGLSAWLMPELTTSEIIQLGLAATGAGTVLYGGKKLLTNKS